MGVLTVAALVLSSLAFAPQAALAQDEPRDPPSVTEPTEQPDSSPVERDATGDQDLITPEEDQGSLDDELNAESSAESSGSDTNAAPSDDVSHRSPDTLREVESAPSANDADTEKDTTPDVSVKNATVENTPERSAVTAQAPTGVCSRTETETRYDYGKNDTPSIYSNSATPGDIGTTICGYISRDADEDAFRYDIAPSQSGRYSIGMTFPSLDTAGAQETYKVRLHNKEGKAVRTWDLNKPAYDGEWLAKQVVQLNAGTWFIMIDSRHSQVYDKEYRLKLSKTSAPATDVGPSPAGCRAEHENADEYGDNDTPSIYSTSATVGTVGATICGYISRDADEDAFRYDIPASQIGTYRLNFKFNSLGQTQFPEAYRVSLYNSAGKALKSWLVSTSEWKGKNFTFSLPEGASFIEVDGDHAQVHGNQYRVTLTRVGGGTTNPGNPIATPFIDVLKDHKFYEEIQWMYTSKATTGIKTGGGLTYAPKGKVTREAMAAFLYRQNVAAGYQPTRQHFTDVPTSHKFYKEIEWMYDKGLSTGIRQGNGTITYSPKAGVSREAMAAFLYRLQGPKGGKAPSSAPFVDVPRNHKFGKEIAWMRSSGLSTGTRLPGGAIYQPKSTVTREAMAAFLYRAR